MPRNSSRLKVVARLKSEISLEQAQVQVNKPGVYRGQCALLCGRGHARMGAIVRAVSPARFDAWLATQKRLIAEANAQAKIARAKLGAKTGAGQVESP